MKAALATAMALTALLGADLAQGAQRYASPGGSGAECAKANPCALKEAITKANANDEVIVGAGSYSITEPTNSPLVGADGVYIHGDFSGPIPLLVGSGGENTIRVTGVGARMSYVDIANTGTGSLGVRCIAGSLERVRASVVGNASIAIQTTSGCTVRDSVARASGINAAALQAGSPFGQYTAIARNVTAIATGTGSKGVYTTCGGCLFSESITLNLKNAIADGTGADLEASGASSTAKIIVSNSNFDVAKPAGGTITEGGGNQTSPPLFVDAPNGDYREVLGSPTIDAGTTDLVGPLDFLGNSRAVGSAPDIGAYEYVPPTPPPPPVATLQSLSLKPKAFRAANVGGAIASRKGRGKGVPVGTTVAYSLSVAGTAAFSVERKAKGRKVGKKCKPQTAKNKAAKKCDLYKPLKGSFTHNGAAGSNSFKFSGRLNGKTLARGSYRLVGSAGGAVRSARFAIVP